MNNSRSARAELSQAPRSDSIEALDTLSQPKNY